MKPAKFLLTFVVICGVSVTLLRGEGVQVNPLERCLARANEDLSTIKVKALEFCGYELGENFQHDTVYDCRNGTPVVIWDCAPSLQGDSHSPDNRCSKDNDDSAQYERRCFSLGYCTPKRGFCGFKSEKDVRKEIIRTVPKKPYTGAQLSFYGRQLERGNPWR